VGCGGANGDVNDKNAKCRNVSFSKSSPKELIECEESLGVDIDPIFYYMGGDIAYKDGDYKQAFELWKKGCDDIGNISSCDSVGNLYRAGRGVKKDVEKGIIYHQKACDWDGARACWGLGFMYEVGQDVEQDYSKAKIFYEKACDLGYSLGCFKHEELNKSGK